MGPPRAAEGRAFALTSNFAPKLRAIHPGPCDRRPLPKAMNPRSEACFADLGAGSDTFVPMAELASTRQEALA
jgi:hypothetical protein